MRSVTGNVAKRDFETILSNVIKYEDSVAIVTDYGAARLVSESEWEEIQETLYLMSIPGMTESILEGGAAPSSECLECVGWDIK